MNKKNELLKSVRYLLDSARSRGTSQGVKVYEIALDQILNAESESDFNDILHRLNKALAGIEAHGGFTNAEYLVVRDIRVLQDSP